MRFLEAAPLREGSSQYGHQHYSTSMKGDLWEIRMEHRVGPSTVAQLRHQLVNGRRVWHLSGYGFLVPHPQMDGLYGVYRRLPDDITEGMGAL